MTHASLCTVLRHLDRLAGARPLDLLGDGELLQRFAARRDEAAFTALVRRHGPMVLGVCLRVLRHAPDAEDAFQATFLVLFRRARALDRSGSLANYLYTVAYHVALRAKAEAARRGRLARELLGVPRERAHPEAVWSDLQPVLDEELARLPDKYRAPVVLCYLQGKSNGEAGRLLGWPAGTVKGRLSRARDLLRTRLARRGVALSVGLVGALLARHTAAAVPSWLVEATVRTPTLGPGVPCPPAAALAERTLRASVPGKGKAAVMLVLALGAIVSGVGALGRWAQARPAAETASSAAPVAPSGALPPDKPAAEEKRDFTVAGQVLGADGKPVPGARVAVIGLAERPYRGRIGYREYETLGAGEADKEGRFRLDCAAETAARAPLREVLASAPGHGLGWSFLGRGAEKDDLVLKLPPEQVIRGHLIDLQGQPVKGAKLHVAEVAPAAKEGSTTSTGGGSGPGGGGGSSGTSSSVAVGWSAPPWGGFPAPPARLEPWPVAATTDDEGRFVVRRLGKEMTVSLLVGDERFARQRLVVRTTDKGKPEAFEQALEPARVLEGTVVGEDTGKAIGKKVLLTVRDPSGELQGWTDEQGRFRVNCSGGHVSISPYPPDGSPYLSRMHSFTWPRGKVKHEVEVKLPRGVLVRGKVSEAGSGKPVAGAVVSYYLREDNPFAHYTIASWRHFPGEFVQTKADGTFEAIVYPGQGSLLARGPSRDYVLQRLDTKELALGKPGGAPLYAEAVTTLDLEAGADPRKDVNLTLQRGVTIRGRVLGPDGKPVAQAVLYHSYHLRDNGDLAYYHHYSLEPVPLKDGRFELTGCDPKAKFPVYLLDRANDVGARVVLSGADAKDEATVRLQPCAKAALGYVDGDGKPVKGLSAVLQLVLDAELHSAISHSEMMGSQSRDGRSDGEGRVTVSGLIPGATYRYVDDQKAKEFTAESGKTHELPDVVYRRPRR
jgi:RNA polymerase sigma factor (sigma-70 family)